MNGWIEARMEKAGWLRFLIWALIYIGYSAWAFLTPGPWMRTLKSLGASNESIQSAGLPELTFGFPDNMPSDAFLRMGSAVSDYALFQAVDIPYAFLGVGFTLAGVSLGLKRFGLGQSPIRYVLIAPLVYLFAEFIENAFLAMMALDMIPDNGTSALAQQAATSVKFIADGVNSAALVIAVGASAAAFLTKPFRRKITD